MLQWMLYVGIFFTLMSLIAFCVYAADKRYAKRHQWRVPEKVLLGLGFLGGAAGALLAMQCLRHKTKHWYFWAVNILGILWQLGLLAWMLWRHMEG